LDLEKGGGLMGVIKVLTGNGYDEPRLAAINHELLCRKNGHQVKMGNVIVYAFGTVKKNDISKEWGFVFDSSSEYYDLMVEVHKSQSIDVVPGDGWNDTPEI